MGKKGAKVYCKLCQNFHSNFERFKMPVGSVYGRNDTTLFVSLYRRIKNDKLGVYLKTPETEWHKAYISINNKICKMIMDFIKEYQNPITIGLYDAPGSKHKNREEIDYSKFVELPNLRVKEKDGIKYYSLPNEFYLPDFIGEKDYKDIAPGLRSVNYDFNVRMKPTFNTYTVSKEGITYIFYNLPKAQDFCAKNGINEELIRLEPGSECKTEISNECSYWSIYKDMNRKLAWSDKEGCYI